MTEPDYANLDDAKYHYFANVLCVLLSDMLGRRPFDEFLSESTIEKLQHGEPVERLTFRRDTIGDALHECLCDYLNDFISISNH